jgi:hypothetical protein
MMANALSDKERALMDAYWRAANSPVRRATNGKLDQKPKDQDTQGDGHYTSRHQ